MPSVVNEVILGTSGVLASIAQPFSRNPCMGAASCDSGGDYRFTSFSLLE